MGHQYKIINQYPLVLIRSESRASIAYVMNFGVIIMGYTSLIAFYD